MGPHVSDDVCGCDALFRPPSIRTLRPRWRGRRESNSQAFCHPNSVHPVMAYGQTFVINTASAPPPPPSCLHLRVNRLCQLVQCQTLAVNIMMDVDRASGAAKRWRERRLRSWWRHEAQRISATLATARHHSAGPPVMTRREEQQEEEEHATNGHRTLLSWGRGRSSCRQLRGRRRRSRSVTWLPRLLARRGASGGARRAGPGHGPIPPPTVSPGWRGGGGELDQLEGDLALKEGRVLDELQRGPGHGPRDTGDLVLALPCGKAAVVWFVAKEEVTKRKEKRERKKRRKRRRRRMWCTSL